MEPITALALWGAGAAGIGKMAGLFGGGGDEGQGQFQQYDPYQEDRHGYIDMLKGLLNTGDTQMQNLYKDVFNRDVIPSVMENYRGKRNPYGYGGDTAETLGMVKAGSQLYSNLGQSAFQSRNELLRQYGAAIEPSTTQYTPAGPSGLENLLSFGGPIASQYMQGQQQQQLFESLFGGGATKKYQDDSLSTFFKPYGASNEEMLKQSTNKYLNID